MLFVKLKLFVSFVYAARNKKHNCTNQVISFHSSIAMPAFKVVAGMNRTLAVWIFKW